MKIKIEEYEVKESSRRAKRASSPDHSAEVDPYKHLLQNLYKAIEACLSQHNKPSKSDEQIVETTWRWIN